VPVFLWLLGAAALATAPNTVVAQWPGEIRGRILDSVTGSAVAGADVTLLPAAISLIGDSGGAFHLQGLNPGTYTITVGALGYSTESLDVDVRDGVVRDIIVALSPAALVIEGVRAFVDGSRAGTTIVTADRIRALPARTVADILRFVPGVLVSSTSPGGPETPSIRGSSADAVLVLVDGVPINDPITGEADLSTLPSAGVASVTVLAGAHSARFGARAGAGAILVRTGSSERGSSVAADVGSLRSWGGEGIASRPAGSGRLDGIATYRRQEGSFEFDVPPELGGGAGTMRNADSRRWTGRLSWATTEETPSRTLGASLEHVARGLPGRSFAPSPTARQTLTQARFYGSGEHLTEEGRAATRFSGYAQYYDTDFSDPAPPFGVSFEDATQLFAVGADGNQTRSFGFGNVAAGVTGRLARIESTVLDSEGRFDRSDFGTWFSTSINDGPAGTSWTATVRVDRSDLPRSWFVSHDIGMRFDIGRFRIQAGHKSSFSPPTLGDQFFREGGGVEPNPDLAAERVPSEWTGGVETDLRLGTALVSLGAEAYDGDVDGMILWQPDFRFVWSPRNRDVMRRGVDLRTRVRLPGRGVEAWADGSVHRTTYDRQNSDDVQVAYRPRYLAGFGASLSHASWSVLVQTTYTGARYPVPNAVNELPGFWATDVASRRSWLLGSSRLEAQIEVERLFDQKDALIFAFPHPGRTVRLTFRVGTGAPS
jgi:vitamin B12 transporter